MGVAAHLGIKLSEYDRRIRTFIPGYEEILDEAAKAAALSTVARPRVLDLGTGTGALAARVLRRLPAARVTGIDEDRGMLGAASRRLRARLTPLVGNFADTPFPTSDIVTASFALHHVRTPRVKRAIYNRAFTALSNGGLLVNADCCPASNAAARARDHAAWVAHLRRAYSPARARGFLAAWAKEDTYFELDLERELLTAAGFIVDVAWRRDGFAVMVGTKG